jgi:hypothetical protein
LRTPDLPNCRNKRGPLVTSILERVPVARISAQAREVHFARMLLAVFAAVLFGVGWLAARVVGLLWLALAWSAVAVREGWRSGKATPIRRAKL